MKNAHSLEVLFEDQWIIVINKPSGMLSVGYPGNPGKTAQDILFDMHRSKGKIRIAAVHRLDRDTSGVMMFARSADAKAEIMDDWQKIVGERTYRCVCARIRGVDPLPDSGTVDEPIAYNRYDVGFVPRPGDRAALKDAEKAVTHYKVIERGERYDLVECELETGRKNQIRVHMAHLGHPVTGDDVYGKDRYGEGEAQDPIGRLALHARVLSFTHPFTGVVHRFEVNESDSFLRAVRAGKKKPNTAPGKTAAETGDGERSSKGGTKTAPRASKDTETVAPPHVPRRQRGKRPAITEQKDSQDRSGGNPRWTGRKESIEDLKDLKPLRERPKNKRSPGESRFIPKR